ncbi:Carbonic anhydrase [Rhodovastum atsumiense]|uniref:carbonic anhydrase n=1 Tax=Rhodovastum atsumiense TaxID=504468 RepID=A0A5M6INU1_9PROT|nr:carbonic anhydrase family protein [Rhodovastum atsumiense]KAA5609922.1 carbonate dehydratase [Rhodovastum atsumiense]CAH2604539.1 Carbonic anhydrase [Rhodovastum atsumiense]
MRRRSFFAALAGIAACPVCAGLARAAESDHAVHWSYEGDTGPTNWSKLSEANRACSIGTRQSPIDIVESIKAELPPLRISFRRGAKQIVNNGHTIQVNVPPGSRTVVGAQTYELLQFHFHHPSEHLIAGKSYPMECHFVHRTAQGTLGVVGVLINEGGVNATFTEIMKLAPAQEGEVSEGLDAIDPNQLLPKVRNYYRYAGSLTTPPCSEDVDWMLLAAPIAVAGPSVAKFTSLYPNDARPPQQAFKRFVLRSS